MSSQQISLERWAEAYGMSPDTDAQEVYEHQPDLMFRSFKEACEWSRLNDGKAFTLCANGVDYRPQRHAESEEASRSWHEFDELYVDGPYRDEMS